jgi:hypothetical protein
LFLDAKVASKENAVRLINSSSCSAQYEILLIATSEYLNTLIQTWSHISHELKSFTQASAIFDVI